MGYQTEIYEWEGDPTQAFANLVWKSRQYNHQVRLRYGYGRIYFTEGDFDEYVALVNEYNDIIKRNLDLLGYGKIIHDSGPWVGFQLGTLPVTGTYLEDVPQVPSYAGDKELTLRVYRNGALIFTKSIYSEKPFRIEPNKRGRMWEFEIEGNVERIEAADFASSMDELKQLQREG